MSYIYLLPNAKIEGATTIWKKNIILCKYIESCTMCVVGGGGTDPRFG